MSIIHLDMFKVYKKELLQEILSILYKYKKYYVSIENIGHFSVSLRFTTKVKLEVILFSSRSNMNLYRYRYSIFTAVQKMKLANNVNISEILTDDIEVLNYLYKRMARYFESIGTIQPQLLLFDLIKLSTSKEVWNIIKDEPRMYVF